MLVVTFVEVKRISYESPPFQSLRLPLLCGSTPWPAVVLGDLSLKAAAWGYSFHSFHIGESKNGNVNSSKGSRQSEILCNKT
jgi:hypothetical protein